MNRHTVWPASIIGALIFISIALFILLHLSRTVYPVNMDMQYMLNYQTVDKNYDAIVAAQNSFNEKYRFNIVTNKHAVDPVEVVDIRGNVHHFEHAFIMGKNRFFVELTDKAGVAVSDMNLTTLISRMDTDEYDQTLEARFVKGRYEFGPFEITNEGRYKILVRAIRGDEIGFFDKAIYAK